MAPKEGKDDEKPGAVTDETKKPPKVAKRIAKIITTANGGKLLREILKAITRQRKPD